jgi:hypothetical protein
MFLRNAGKYYKNTQRHNPEDQELHIHHVRPQISDYIAQLQQKKVLNYIISIYSTNYEWPTGELNRSKISCSHGGEYED